MAVGDRLAREVMEQSTVGAQKILDHNSEHFENNSRHGKKRREAETQIPGAKVWGQERNYHNLVKSGPEELFCFQGLFCFLKFPHLLLHSGA